MDLGAEEESPTKLPRRPQAENGQPGAGQALALTNVAQGAGQRLHAESPAARLGGGPLKGTSPSRLPMMQEEDASSWRAPP